MVDTHGSVVTVVPFSLHSAVLQLKNPLFAQKTCRFTTETLLSPEYCNIDDTDAPIVAHICTHLPHL